MFGDLVVEMIRWLAALDPIDLPWRNADTVIVTLQLLQRGPAGVVGQIGELGRLVGFEFRDALNHLPKLRLARRVFQFLGAEPAVAVGVEKAKQHSDDLVPVRLKRTALDLKV